MRRLILLALGVAVGVTAAVCASAYATHAEGPATDEAPAATDEAAAAEAGAE